MLLLPLALLAGCKSPAPRPDLVDNRFYAPAAAQGNPIAQNQLGQAYETHWRPTEANSWLHKAALHGQRDAMYTLGLNYLNGAGVQRNTTEAFAWFSIGASQDQLACRNAKQTLTSRLTPAEVEEGNRRAAVLLAEIAPADLIYKEPVSVKLHKEKNIKAEQGGVAVETRPVQINAPAHVAPATISGKDLPMQKASPAPAIKKVEPVKPAAAKPASAKTDTAKPVTVKGAAEELQPVK
ncbi:MAG: hypothetical protein RLZZ350_2654 [Verrucomicrobiota bacterium]